MCLRRGYDNEGYEDDDVERRDMRMAFSFTREIDNG